MKKYAVNVHYDAVISVEVLAENEEQALDIAINKANDIPLNDADIVGTNPCVADVQELTPIMNDTNNHNPELVNKVNEAYWTKKNDFDAILFILTGRDKEEMAENQIEKTDVHSYLMQVADDKDLECIINYCRID